MMIIPPLKPCMQRTLKLLPVGLLVALPCFALDITFRPAHSLAASEALETAPTTELDDPLPSSLTYSDNIELLPPVTVIAAPVPMTGQGNSLRGDLLEQLPLRNNSINEALTVLPGVQYSESSNISTQGGEILPPGVSISGGKIFENNFTIDGINNNSLLDPDGETDPVTNNDLPGHAQELFLDASLVERITVYDSNVSARFSNFKGGVVDAETITPLPCVTGKLFYRTTRDEWTSFHIDPENEEEFLNSTTHNAQPKFAKHHVGFDLHVPLSPRLLTVSAYRLLHSRIPLKEENNTKTQERRQENFFFKTLFHASKQTDIDLLWAYTPYRGDYYKDGYSDSDFSLNGGGHMFAASSHSNLSFASLDIKAAYHTSENTRKAPPHQTLVQNPDGSWDKEGFLGDIEKTQQSAQLKADLSFVPLKAGTTTHHLNTGIDLQHVEGTTERQDTSYLNYYFTAFSLRYVYEEGDASATLHQYGCYLEDIVSWNRLEIRPGLRLDYDDYMHNLNLAPRLAASFDVFADGRTLLTGGLNRYYSGTLLTYKLREGLKPRYTERWSAEDGWTYSSGISTKSRYSQLKTPYADEWMLGLEQQLFGGKAIAKYVRREGRDEFAHSIGEEEEDGFQYDTLNNNGRSSHESYSLSWDRQWRNHYISINGTYQETDSSNESYDVLLEEEEKYGSLDGQLTPLSQLTRSDFNRHWVINLTYSGKLPHGFSFSGLAKYRSGYNAILKTGSRDYDIVLPDGTSPYIYEEVKRGGAVTIDCRICWEKKLYSSHIMILSLEINNLLNKKSPVANTDDYEIGRQVWAGMEYRF